MCISMLLRYLDTLFISRVYPKALQTFNDEFPFLFPYDSPDKQYLLLLLADRGLR